MIIDYQLFYENPLAIESKNPHQPALSFQNLNFHLKAIRKIFIFAKHFQLVYFFENSVEKQCFHLYKS